MRGFLFLTVNAINIFSFLMFLSRVHFENFASVFGLFALLAAIPAALIGVINLLQKAPFFSWFPALVYASWGVLDLFLDHLYKIEFRQPMRPAILVPFLVLYYGSIAGMGFSFWKVNFSFWLICAITSALNVSAAFYAILNGKG
ncbi:MAG TPA: hypothetical protein PKW59_04105 [Thermotogota bacterium]|nr:hypothetical protein [Thermotogota bacterium]